MSKQPGVPGYQRKLSPLQIKIVVAVLKDSRAENKGRVGEGVLTHIRDKYKLTKSELMYMMQQYGFYGRNE